MYSAGIETTSLNILKMHIQNKKGLKESIPHISTYPNQQQIKFFIKYQAITQALSLIYLPLYIKFNAILGSWLAVDNSVADAC